MIRARRGRCYISDLWCWRTDSGRVCLSMLRKGGLVGMDRIVMAWFVHSVRFMDVWETFVGYGRSWKKGCAIDRVHKSRPKDMSARLMQPKDWNQLSIKIEKLNVGLFGVENCCKKRKPYRRVTSHPLFLLSILYPVARS